MSTLHIFKESLILTIHTCRYQGRIQRGVAYPTTGTRWKKEKRVREKRKEGKEQDDR